MHKSKNLAMQAICFLLLCFNAGCQEPVVKKSNRVVAGNTEMEKYLPLLKNKRVAVLTNMSGNINNTSLVDSLISLKINVVKVFVPEHGFRGDVDAGEKVSNTVDKRTGLPIVSLYGKNKKPQSPQLVDIDVLVYDIQDLGVRFYTYISTMSYAMEACAENKKKMIVLDRPNPNGFYVDGPVLQPEFRSFLGLHPVPVVYGMTCGEYAMMVNGEGWLKDSAHCDLTVIPLQNYDRAKTCDLEVKPSPNIPNAQAVLLYPALGLFEGTIMSLGRGTAFPFQVVGHPEYPDTGFYFIPQPGAVSKHPRYENKKCYGIDLRQDSVLSPAPGRLRIDILRNVYNSFQHTGFFEKTFNAHAGNSVLQEQIRNQVPESEIRKSWAPDLDAFMKIRARYLLYPDVK